MTKLRVVTLVTYCRDVIGMFHLVFVVRAVHRLIRTQAEVAGIKAWAEVYHSVPRQGEIVAPVFQKR